MPADRSAREILRLLRRIAAGEPRARNADPALVAGLRRRALLEDGPDGRLALTGTGLAFLRRGLADPDGFARQHQIAAEAVIADDALGRQRVLVNEGESPLARLRRQKGRDGRPLIDAAAFAAGERLRAEFTRARLMPRVTSNWTAAIAGGRRDGRSGGMADLTDAAVAARQRVEKALGAVGPEFADLLVDVCCFLKGVEDIEASRSWPARSAKLVIGLALASLARHYGLAGTARGNATGRLVHWGADGYRPRIAPGGREGRTSSPKPAPGRPRRLP